MSHDSSMDSLKKFLSDKGHTPKEIELVMSKLAEYEKTMVVDSIFDSIANGTFNFEVFVEEALKTGVESDTPGSDPPEATQDSGDTRLLQEPTRLPDR
jgi:hypothetical protein